jgi:hypothetical protein
MKNLLLGIIAILFSFNGWAATNSLGVTAMPCYNAIILYEDFYKDYEGLGKHSLKNNIESYLTGINRGLRIAGKSENQRDLGRADSSQGTFYLEYVINGCKDNPLDDLWVHATLLWESLPLYVHGDN